MALTDIAIRKAQYTGTPAYGQKLSDGGGLFIWISKHGKYWRLAYRYDKKQKTLALGIYPQVSLTEARQKREEAKKQLADGIDPAIGKKIEQHTISLSKAANFKALAALWFDNWKKGKTEPKRFRLATLISLILRYRHTVPPPNKRSAMP